MVKLAEAFEAYKKACILYGYNIEGSGDGCGEEEYAYWQEQVLVTEKYLVDAIVEIVKAERDSAQSTGRRGKLFGKASARW